jgi:hypothetical protein
LLSIVIRGNYVDFVENIIWMFVQRLILGKIYVPIIERYGD